jgi:spore coat protein CotH
VFNPEQLLNLSLSMAPGDWSAVLADTSYTLVVQARLRCNDGPELLVGVRRKRSGGQQKVGLKIDFNHVVPGQDFQGLRKLSLENGVSSGSNADTGDVRGLVAEYLGWRLMSSSGAVSSRAALVTLTVNGSSRGVFVNVEQVDKGFLDRRLGNNDGWLYKRSGSDGDGFKTHETDGLNDPYDDYFCFFAKGGGSCAMPSATVMAGELPPRLDIPQLLRMGAVNAIIANTDAPIFKDNNYYWYDRDGGPRLYLPWDLDTTMNDGAMNVFTGGVGGQVSFYTDALFSNWQGDYKTILQQLLAGGLTRAAIFGELDRAARDAGAALDAAPYASGDTASALAALTSWWTARLTTVQSQVANR